ncbi:MAG: hypothetical protein HWD61_10770 [Parachlamydiaceae bacterium]|nr:MAG: hypothetical protein HWD61_10770 [Parachlamydiaceae bacterium]
MDILKLFNLLHMNTLLASKMSLSLKIEACKNSLDFIKQLGGSPDYVFFASRLAQSERSEEEIEILLKSLPAKGVVAYLIETLNSNRLKQIKKTFKCFCESKTYFTTPSWGLSFSPRKCRYSRQSACHL